MIPCTTKLGHDNGVFTYREFKCNICLKEENNRVANVARGEHLTKRRVNAPMSPFRRREAECRPSRVTSSFPIGPSMSSDASPYLSDASEDMDTNSSESDATCGSENDSEDECPFLGDETVTCATVHTSSSGVHGIALIMSEDERDL